MIVALLHLLLMTLIVPIDWRKANRKIALNLRKATKVRGARISLQSGRRPAAAETDLKADPDVATAVNLKWIQVLLGIATVVVVEATAEASVALAKKRQLLL